MLGGTSGPQVYLASPLGFFEAGRDYLASTLIPELRAKGFVTLDPWSPPDALAHELRRALNLEPGPTREAALSAVNRALGARNAELIRSAASVLAVLDGPDVDSGTAAEVGYAAALGVPVVGLYTDLRSAGDNSAAPVNLQVLYFIAASGGALERSLVSAVERLRGVERAPPAV